VAPQKRFVIAEIFAPGRSAGYGLLMLSIKGHSSLSLNNQGRPISYLRDFFGGLFGARSVDFCR
jgi:hypothetical protein